MKMRQASCAVVLLVLALAGLSPAAAIQTGWYVGAGLGDADVDRSGFDDDRGLKFFGGYNINEQVAIEAAHVDLGEFDRGSIEFDVDGWQFAVLGHLTLGEKFSVFGKGGLYLWDADGKGVRDDDGTDITFGFGVLYDTEKWGIRVEWERFDDTEPGDIDLLSVNGILHF